MRFNGRWGVHKYAAHPSTSVLCAAFAVADAPPELWIPDAPCPEIIKRAVSEGWIVHAINANFEMAIEHHISARVSAGPSQNSVSERCTMAMALALSLPAKLDAVARALELRHQKDAVGHRLMLMMAKPRKPHKDEDPEAASIGSRIRIASGACTNMSSGCGSRA